METIKTANQLFPHDCALEHLRFSAYNPRSVSFYCVECGGNVSIRAARRDWTALFATDSLALTSAALDRVLDPEAEAAEAEARRQRHLS